MPSRPRIDLWKATPQSIAHAKAAAAAERAAVEEQCKWTERRSEIEAIETLYRLVKRFGSPRVSIWLTAAALRAGEKL